MKIIKSLLLLLFSGLSLFVHSQCSTMGPLAADAIVNNPSAGSFDWDNEANALLSDNARATAGSLIGVLSSANSNNLVFTNLNFAIPAMASICGIEVSLVEVTDNNGKSIVVSDTKIKNGLYKLLLPALPVGAYIIRLTINGATSYEQLFLK